MPNSDFSNAPTQRQVTDPVCGMIIAADDAVAKIEHGDHNHYFCSEKCRVTFELNPKKYH
jgi:YHS domain-containing protein